MSAAHGPGGRDPGPEDEWARIVAGLEDVRRAGDRHLGAPRDPGTSTPGPERSGTERSGPEPGGLGSPRPEHPGEGRPGAPGTPPGGAEPGNAPGTPPGGTPEEAPDDEAPYSPDPGPVTQGLSGGALVAWALLVGVPLLLVVLAVLPGTLPWWALATGLTVVVGAIGHLLRSLPEERDEFDDGARV